jgi:hypothetical protein
MHRSSNQTRSTPPPFGLLVRGVYRERLLSWASAALRQRTVWFRLPRRGNPELVFGFDSVLVVVGGLLAVILLVAGVAYLRWLSARRGRSGGKRA